MIRRPWLRDLVTALIGLWIVAGVHLDGWAHVHVPQLETFFTPWHASFYSGLLAFMLWLGLVARSARQPGDSLSATVRRMPPGYRGAVWGAAIFAVAGIADMFWHELLGIEVSIAALLSPPHLALLSGVLLMGATGWRSQRTLSAKATLPELISLTSVVAICGFFLNFLSPFQWAPPTTHSDYRVEVVSIWVSGQLVTTAMLLVPLLWQLRDNRHRIGTLTAFTTAVGLGLSLGLSRTWDHALLLAGVAGAVVGALIGDVLLARTNWPQWRYGLPSMFGLIAALIWGGQLIGFALAAGVVWPVTLWGGALLYSAGVGAAIAAVLWRPGARTSPGESAAGAEPAVVALG